MSNEAFARAHIVQLSKDASWLLTDGHVLKRNVLTTSLYAQATVEASAAAISARLFGQASPPA